MVVDDGKVRLTQTCSSRLADDATSLHALRLRLIQAPLFRSCASRDCSAPAITGQTSGSRGGAAASRGLLQANLRHIGHCSCTDRKRHSGRQRQCTFPFRTILNPSTNPATCATRATCTICTTRSTTCPPSGGDEGLSSSVGAKRGVVCTSAAGRKARRPNRRRDFARIRAGAYRSRGWTTGSAARQCRSK